MSKTEDDNKGVEKSLSEEIDAGVDDVMQNIEAASKNDEKGDRGEGDGSAEVAKNDEPKDGEAAPEGSKDEDGGEAKGSEGDGGKDAVTDEHLERAVKSGLTMAEARQFGSASHLEAVLSRLEAAGKKDGSNGNRQGEEKTDGDGKDPLDGIPDLDPEEYDDKIVKGFGAMKNIIRAQQETIQALRAEKPVEADWFKAQAAGLDKAVSEAVKSDPTKMEAIREKFAVLSAGYKAAGKDTAREAIFQEAVRITLGDVIAQAAVDDKARKLARRSGQHINRPSGRRESPSGDVTEEIAAELDQKFFKKP